MMMAVALYSIEKDLKQIAETQQKILTFLEVENESQIEADVESLMGIVANYNIIGITNFRSQVVIILS